MKVVDLEILRIISDGTSNNRVAIRVLLLRTNEIEVYVVSKWYSKYLKETIFHKVLLILIKYAFQYTENNFSFFVNGFELATDTSGTYPYWIK